MFIAMMTSLTQVNLVPAAILLVLLLLALPLLGLPLLPALGLGDLTGSGLHGRHLCVDTRCCSRCGHLGVRAQPLLAGG